MMGIVVLTTWVVALAMNAERAQHICIGQVLGGGGGVDGGGLSPELCYVACPFRRDTTFAHMRIMPDAERFGVPVVWH